MSAGTVVPLIVAGRVATRVASSPALLPRAPFVGPNAAEAGKCGGGTVAYHNPVQVQNDTIGGASAISLHFLHKQVVAEVAELGRGIWAGSAGLGLCALLLGLRHWNGLLEQLTKPHGHPVRRLAHAA